MNVGRVAHAGRVDPTGLRRCRDHAVRSVPWSSKPWGGEPLRLPLPEVRVDDPLADDDLNLALYTCYELHYRSFEGVGGDWEWDPWLLSLRAELEARFEDALREQVAHLPVAAHEVERTLRTLVAADAGRRFPASLPDTPA